MGSRPSILSRIGARPGLRLEAVDDFKKRDGLESLVTFVAEDFDAPLPEDFLLRQLPNNPY